MRRLATPLTAILLLAGCASSTDEAKREKYEGMSCAKIGHAYNIEPGIDPEHDRDADGVACENYRDTNGGGFGGGGGF